MDFKNSNGKINYNISFICWQNMNKKYEKSIFHQIPSGTAPLIRPKKCFTVLDFKKLICVQNLSYV